MKNWLLVGLGLAVLSSCVTRTEPAPVTQEGIPVTATTVTVKWVNLGETLAKSFYDNQVKVTDLLDDCAKSLCDREEERAQAAKLSSLRKALLNQQNEQIQVLALSVNDDFRNLFNTYLGKKEYAVPVLYEAWFLAGGLYPYSKTISAGLFEDVKRAQAEMESKSPRPPGYYLLLALQTEFQPNPAADKAIAYKRCIDLEPNNKRCQERFQRWASSLPRNYKTVETPVPSVATNAATPTVPSPAVTTTPTAANVPTSAACVPEVNKEGFSLYIADTKSSSQFPVSKSFLGKKYYHAREDFAASAEIERIQMSSDETTLKVELVPRLEGIMRNLSKKHARKSWVLVRQELIYATGIIYPSTTLQVPFTRLDKEGFAGLTKKCE